MTTFETTHASTYLLSECFLDFPETQLQTATLQLLQTGGNSNTNWVILQVIKSIHHSLTITLVSPIEHISTTALDPSVLVCDHTEWGSEWDNFSGFEFELKWTQTEAKVLYLFNLDFEGYVACHLIVSAQVLQAYLVDWWSKG